MRHPVVLLYQAVLPPPSDADREERGLLLHPDRFTEQMEDLAVRGFRILTLNEYAQTLVEDRYPSKSVLLTFDDAYAHIDEVVTPVLRRFGFFAVMFAPAQHLGGKNTWDSEHRHLARLDIASVTQLRQLDTRVWDVASHGLRHVSLTSIDSAHCVAELADARERLSEILGRPVRDLAYPNGVATARVRHDAEKAGYRTGFLAGPSNGINRFQIPRHPVRGDESIELFRLKTSAWVRHLYGINALTPAWLKTRVRAVIQ